MSATEDDPDWESSRYRRLARLNWHPERDQYPPAVPDWPMMTEVYTNTEGIDDIGEADLSELDDWYLLDPTDSSTHIYVESDVDRTVFDLREVR